MKRFALAALLVLVASTAQEVRAAEPSFGHGLLFRVTDTESRRKVDPSHIFATFESNDPRLLSLPARAIAAFDAADRVVLQTKASAMARFMQYNRRYPSRTDGGTLAQLLDPPAMTLATQVAAKYDLWPTDIAPQTPLALILKFSRPPPELAREAEGGATLGGALENEATALVKKIYTLESAEQHLQHLTTLAPSQQVLLLKYTLQEHDRLTTGFAAAVELYLKRDLAGLLRHVEGESRKIGDLLGTGYFDRLVVARNRRMVERLNYHLRAGNAFIALDAAHLPGPEGVLHLLQERGFTVARVE